MKVRWREHEFVLVTITTFIVIGAHLWDAWRITPQQINSTYAELYLKHHIPFNYFTRVLLPQIGSTLVLWLAYMWMNKIIISHLLSGVKTVSRGLLIALQLIIIIYLLGPGINFASFYINPYYMSPGEFAYLPLTFGYHPQPFLNVFGGINMSLMFVTMYALYASFREALIYHIERPGPRSSYHVMITNQITLFMVMFLASPIFTANFHLVTGHAYYGAYFAILLPVLSVFTSNTYWLFPLKGDKSFFNWQFLGPLLFSTFVYALVFSIFLGPEWSIIVVCGIWISLVVVITPISWIDYQQRKDKILQLRGMEKALVKSTADLQFLRSQINPHFLFNALNTLYGTALIEGSKNTAEGIQKLGDMMRFMLYENTLDFIPMDKEIAYLKNYIALQKLRTQLSPDIMIEDDITDQQCDHQIAPMLLIPFVENAFKHGVSLAERSWIKIKLTCNEAQVCFEVRNSLHVKTDNDPEREHSGIGLKNVQERLSLLYPRRHQFIFGEEGGEFVVRLTINKTKS
jgi:two-component system LytT family sensor kinase